MKLSKRLGCLANLIHKHSKDCILGDIGSDHGYLPCYLALNNIVTKAYACDVAELPLESAKKSIEHYKVQNLVEAKLGNGINPLLDTDTNVFSISGMGSHLIVDILEANLKYAKTMKKIYLQANSNVDYLRKYLYDHGFTIIDEEIVYESKHFYEIMVIEYTGNVENIKFNDYYFGPILRQKKSSTFIDKWNKQLNVFNKVLPSVSNDQDKAKDIKYKIKHIEEVLHEC